MAVEIATTCIQLVHLLIQIKEELHDNFTSSKRLLDRCILLQQPLSQIHLHTSVSTSALTDLKKTLEDIKDFTTSYLEEINSYRAKKVKDWFKKIIFRKEDAKKIGELNDQLNEACDTLNIVQALDFEKKRQEDVEVRIE